MRYFAKYVDNVKTELFACNCNEMYDNKEVELHVGDERGKLLQ